MDFVLEDEIRELMQWRGENCVSLYMPTHRAGRETEQDPIRLDNLLRGAEKELTAGGTRSPEAREMLGPAHSLLKEGVLTRRLAEGLSIFISREFFRYFRLPIHFQERFLVGRQFYLRPLAPMLHCCKKFYVFALSRKSVRLLECTEFGVNEIDLRDVPPSMGEALGIDEEATMLFRSVRQGNNGKGAPMVHGHGGGAETEKEYLWRWFQILKNSLHPYLREERSPLVFAGVEYLFPMFRIAEVYKNTIPEFVEGNPDELDPSELLKKSLPLVSPYFLREREKALERYMELSGGPLASNDIEEILPEARAGRIDTLFLNSGIQKWGKHDPVSDLVEVHPEQQKEDEDLLDLAFRNVYLNRGNVFGLDSEHMPGGSYAAAILRY